MNKHNCIKLDKSKSDNESEKFELIQILDHKKKGDRYIYKVKYSEKSRVRQRWVDQDNLHNCDAIIRSYFAKINHINISQSKPHIKINQYTIIPKPSCDTLMRSKKRQRIDNVNDVNDVNDVHEDIELIEDEDLLSMMMCKTNVLNNNENEFNDVDNLEIKRIKHHKKPKITASDEIVEIENILGCKKVQNHPVYIVKMVGSANVTEIAESEFIETDILKEFWHYETLRNSLELKNRAFIYCRTSKRNTDTEVSLHQQELHCKYYAKSRDMNVVGIYRDNGVSAKDMAKQYSLNWICNNVKAGDTVLVYDVSRFSRNMLQGLQRLEILRKNLKVCTVSCNDNMVWNNKATCRATIRQSLSASQLHSDVTSEKVKSSIEYRKKRGDYIGNAPYGYQTQYINGIRKLIKRPDEYAVVRYILNTFRKIARINTKSKSIDLKKCVFDLKDYQSVRDSVNRLYTNRKNNQFSLTAIKNILNDQR
jgi:DNA invertase Pin-like site-specific DNA recombinase